MTLRAWYTLGEPAGAAGAGDSSGNQAPALVMGGTGADVAFGNDGGPRSASMARFTGTGEGTDTGKYLRSVSSFNITNGAVELWFTPISVPVTYARGIIDLDAAGVPNGPYLGLKTTMMLYVYSPATGVIDLTTLAVGSLHQVVWTVDGGSTKVYLDGSPILTSATLPANIEALTVGRLADDTTKTFDGLVSQLAIYDSGLSSTRVAAHYSAGQAAYESGTAQIARLAGYAGLPVGTLDASLTDVPFVDDTGASAWSAIQQVADAEMGVAFFDGSGNLTFHNRNRVAAKTSPDLILSGSYVVPDAQPTQDDERLINYLKVTASATGVAQLARDATSETNHGRYDPGEQTYLLQTDAEALDRANWIVANFAEPTTRFGTLTINLFGMTPAQQQAVIAAIEINCWLRVTNFPSQTPGGTTVDVVVEGFTETRSGDEWKIACNVVSRSLFDCLILDDPVRGVLEGPYSRLYV